jgi:hypothetical protein
LFPLALGQKRVEQLVVEPRLRLTGAVARVAVIQGPAPGLVIDAGRFVTEHHPLILAAAQQTVDDPRDLLKAGPVAADLERLNHWLEVVPLITGTPMDIFANVQPHKKCGIILRHE